MDKTRRENVGILAFLGSLVLGSLMLPLSTASGRQQAYPTGQTIVRETVPGLWRRVPVETPSLHPAAEYSGVVKIIDVGDPTRFHYEWRSSSDTTFSQTRSSGSLVEQLPDGSANPQYIPENTTFSYDSSCWATLCNDLGPIEMRYTPAQPPEGYARGSRLNLNLLAAPSPGDFLSPAATVGESSLCLVPPAAEGMSTGWQGATRPTVSGVVDLVTGMPLAQVTDLELPLDGATFRLTRTRSADHKFDSAALSNKLRYLAGTDRWWDWVGAGWMAGENPILLIDAQLPDVSGPGTTTTWLWIDAHHSIPFQRIAISGQVRYEAPPRFRARMEHNGTWVVPTGDGSVAHWATPPTQFDVWLYDGAVHYTFVAIFEDVPPNYWNKAWLNSTTGNQWEWSSYHDAPVYKSDVQSAPGEHNLDSLGGYNFQGSRGFGVPYYGLCTRVSDDNGHAAEIEYCSVPRLSVDDPSSTDAVECIQDAQAKGQIKYIKLLSGSTVRWTLMYAHRRFPGLVSGDLPGYLASQYRDTQRPELYELHGYSAIDRIYVYQGDVDKGKLDAARMTIHERTLPPLMPDPNVPDPLTWHNTHLQSGEQTLPFNWVHQVRYFYDSDIVAPESVPEQPLVCSSTPPVLLKTTVRTRNTNLSASPNRPDEHESVKTTIFVHKSPWRQADTFLNGNGAATGAGTSIPWLRMIFTDADIHRLIDAHTWAGVDVNPNFDFEDFANKLAFYGTSEGPSDPTGRIASFASVRWEPDTGSAWGTEASIFHPAFSSLETLPAGLHHYFSVNATQAWNDGWDSSAAIVVIGGRGTEQHYYRIHHVIIPPDSYGTTSTTTCVFLDGVGGHPDSFTGPPRRAWRSVYAHPYLWQTDIQYPYAPLIPALREPADLTKARFVKIIDEFPIDDPDSTAGAPPLYDEAGLNYDTDHGTKHGQLSRRVVEVSASGFVLRDRKWAFTGMGTIVSGGGLGEERVYKTVLEACPGVNGDLRLAHEVVPVELRSVGWSAADLGGHAVDNGLIHFTTYEVVDDESAPEGKRVEPKAAGIMRGTQGTRWAEGRLFRSFVNDGTSSTLETTIQLRFGSPTDAASAEGLTAPSVTVQGLLSLAGPAYSNSAATVTIVRRTLETDPNFPNQPERERRVLSRSVIGPPRQQRPNSDVWYFPVEREWYDNKGNVTWSATGLVKNPLNPADSDPLDSLIFTWYSRYAEDDANTFARGQTHHTIVDTEQGASVMPKDGSAAVTVSSWPEAGWERHVTSSVTARHATTTYSYGWYGLQDVYFPTGRRWAKRVLTFPKSFLLDSGDVPNADYLVGLPRYIAREYILNDLEPDSAHPGRFTAASAGEVIDHASMQPNSPFIKRRVEFTNAFSVDFANVDDNGSNNGNTFVAPQFTRLAAAKIALDSSGRARNAELLQWSPASGWLALGSKMINDLGEVYRELDLDGTITRITRNSLGQDLRRYTGTSDEGWVTGGSGTYNMVLVDRTEYGLGETNAWLPTVVHKYSSSPSWDRDYYGTPTNDVATGLSETSYDWRMRPVRHDTFRRAGSDRLRESTTLTYLDHLDRPRFVATIGEGTTGWLTGHLLPETLGGEHDSVAEDLPTASEFLQDHSASGVAQLTSLSETKYGPDGTMTEQRTYNVAWNQSMPTSARFHKELHLRGQAGQETFTQRTDGVHVSKMDGLGRVTSTALVAPGQASGSDPYGYELSRTDYVYDRYGNAVDVATLERVKPDGDALLADGAGTLNAVRTRTVSWYDSNKRLVATAVLGTEQAGGYVAGSQGFVRHTEAGTNTSEFDADAPIFNPQTGEVTRRSGLSASAPLHMYLYDKQGNQTHAAEAKGESAVVTLNEYNSLGRLVKKTENATETAQAKRRITEYVYHLGRIQEIRASRTNNDKENTRVEYTAKIVNESFEEVSTSKSLIGTMMMPEPSSGVVLETTPAFFTLKYNFQGHIAERIDPRGVAFRYSYDDAERLSKVQVGWYLGTGGSSTWQEGYPAPMNPVTGSPVDRIQRVTYSYDTSGHLQDIKAYTAGNLLTTHNRYQYDLRGDLTEDAQAYGGEVAASTPRTKYGWDFGGSSDTSGYDLGYSRLASMTYPVQANLTARIINFSYGQSGSVDAQLSRLTGLSTNLAPVGQPTNLAQFGLSGAGRRASLGLANGKILQNQHLGNETGYSALDSFGRLLDLHAKNAAGDTLFRSQYTYDISGNRITAKLTQAPVSQGGSSDNVLSQRNTYDALDRLTGTQVGALDNSGNIPSPDRSDTWNLDLLGNWVGNSTAAGRVTTIGSTTSSFGYGVDQRNRMTAVSTTAASGTTTKGVRYDPAGNLQFDGTYYYQYDAWNRLIQINQGLWDNGTGGQDTGTIAIGALVKNYAFDGLGRLARTVSPYPNPAAAGGYNRTERFYYDGIRRIQEVYTDPVVSSAAAGTSGDATLQQLGSQTTPPNGDPQGTPLGLEAGQIAGVTPIQPTPWLEREYVWGPGDGPGGIDELLVQYDNQRNPWWVIQDEGGDVAAICDLGAVNQDGRVAGQYTYDAYGSPLSFDNLHAHPLMHCGHKGLLVDRLDVGVVAAAGAAETHRLAVGSTIFCHNRNRTYSPAFGRFLQQDPNAAGSTLNRASAKAGHPLEGQVNLFSVPELYGDGVNIYQYLRGAGWMGSDPLGLSWEVPIGIDFEGLGPQDLDEALDWMFDNVPMSTGVMVYARVAVMAYRMARDLTVGYSSNLDSDSDWASDWSLSDDMHSRLDASWVNEIVGNEVQEFMNFMDPSSGLPMSAVRSGGGGHGGGGHSGGGGKKHGPHPHGGGGGTWQPRGHHASARAIEYEERVCKKLKPGHEYELNGTRFDSHEGGALIDAKGPGYAKFVDKKTGKFHTWFEGGKGIGEQAKRQVAAAKGARIEWRVAEERAAHAIREELKRVGAHGKIHVRVVE